MATLAIVASGACAGRYRPTQPVRARSGDVELAVESCRLGEKRDVELRSRSQATHVIRQGWITVPTRSPCSGGAPALEIVVDSAAPAGGPDATTLTAGEHEIDVTFPHGGFDLDMVVDLELEDHGCARVPAVSQDVPMVITARNVVLFGTDLGNNGNLTGLQGIYGFSLGVGRWMGPALVTASAGVAGSLCNPDLCGRASEGGSKSGLAFPFSLETRSLLHVFDSAIMGVNMVTAGVRYSFASVSLPTPDGDRRFGVHGLQVVPAWWIAGVPRGPFPHGERAAHFEFSFPVGVLYEPAASTKSLAFNLGLGLRFVFPTF